ncbi:MBL fold metallo-hydrolase [Streptomyces sp. NPDC047860]|uniref:MBL fold metallo-hydrolase n=1 Tax=Streptomyces sp. NPDC047860 TaxID=3155743 RepID=UPI0033F7FB15
MTARVERVVTTGVVPGPDADTRPMENNVWIIGDDEQAITVDAAHEPDVIATALGDRRVVAIACTHAHSGHVDAAVALSDRTGAPIMLHPDDLELWRRSFPSRVPDEELVDGRVIDVAGTALEVRHTPGHTPGSVSLYDPALRRVFTGDMLLSRGPGTIGPEDSDFQTMIQSIRERLVTLPPETVVCPGHGDVTTVGEVGERVEDWLRRIA